METPELSESERHAIRLNMWANRAVGMASDPKKAADIAVKLAKDDDAAIQPLSPEDKNWLWQRTFDLWHVSNVSEEQS